MTELSFYDIAERTKGEQARNEAYRSYFEQGYTWVTNTPADSSDMNVAAKVKLGMEAVAVEPAFDRGGNIVKGLKAILVKGLSKTQTPRHNLNVLAVADAELKMQTIGPSTKLLVFTSPYDNTRKG